MLVFGQGPSGLERAVPRTHHLVAGARGTLVTTRRAVGIALTGGQQVGEAATKGLFALVAAAADEAEACLAVFGSVGAGTPELEGGIGSGVADPTTIGRRGSIAAWAACVGGGIGGGALGVVITSKERGEQGEQGPAHGLRYPAGPAPSIGPAPAALRRPGGGAGTHLGCAWPTGGPRQSRPSGGSAGRCRTPCAGAEAASAGPPEAP